MSDYLEQKKRNKVRRQLKRVKPWLISNQMEDEIDRVLGVAKSGKMDWAEIISGTKTSSKYPNPDSVKYDDFQEVSKEYKVRPYILYWFYLKKVSKLQASGRKKSDYKALLIDIAPSCIGKELGMDTKIVAATIYAKDLSDVMLTRQEVESMIIGGKI